MQDVVFQIRALKLKDPLAFGKRNLSRHGNVFQCFFAVLLGELLSGWHHSQSVTL